MLVCVWSNVFVSVCAYTCIRVCISALVITVGAGVSSPVVCADAAEASGVLHTGSFIHTGGRQARMLH